MVADTCIQCVIHASEKGFNIKGQILYERAVNLILDTDGDWYRNYEDKYPIKKGAVITTTIIK